MARAPMLTGSRTAEIGREELRRRLHDPTLVIIDVLPRESWDAGHVPGALSLPIAELAERAPSLIPDRTAEIAVYCGGPT